VVESVAEMMKAADELGIEAAEPALIPIA